MEVQQSADVGLMVTHSGGKKCNLSGKIFNENFDEMSLNLLVGGFIFKNIGFLAVGEPVLYEGGSRFNVLRGVLSHEIL